MITNHKIKTNICTVFSYTEFNKICKPEQVTPRYIHITVNGNNQKSLNTKNTAIKYRINQELKYLYKKKSLLNKQLYVTHLECANYWQDAWFCVQTSLKQKINHMNDILYNKLNTKLDTLQHITNKQTEKHEEHNIQTTKPSTPI
jgi:hypothetical protein